MKQSQGNIEEMVKQLNTALQLETDLRLSCRQRATLVLDRQVTISHAAFKPFARRAHHYLAITSEDDRVWSCVQDLATLDYTIYLLP